MKRKVNKVGPTTLSITLPAKWVKTNNVKKGDELELDMKNNALTISQDQYKITEVMEETIPQTTEGHVKSIINNIYRRGYDEAILRFESENEKKHLISALQETMGFEIIEQREKHLVIKNLGGNYENEFDALMRRAFLVTLTIADDGYTDLLSGKIDIDKYWQLKRTVEKLMNVCCRCLNSGSMRGLPTSKLTYLIVHTIDKIAYDYYYILRYAKDKKTTDKKISDVMQYYSKVSAYLRKFYDAYYKKDTNMILELTTEKDDLIWKQGYALLQDKNAVIIHHLMNIVRRTYECCSPFLGENLEIKTSSYTQEPY